MNKTTVVGLLRKEWLVSKHTFILMLMSFLGIWLIGVSCSIYYTNPFISQFITCIILAFHLFYLTIFILGGLMMEGKTQLWLHTPQSTVFLLMGKIITGFYLHIISFSIFSVAFMITFLAFPNQQDMLDSTILVLGGFDILINGLELALYLMFYWGIYHAMGTVNNLRKYRLICFFVFLIACHAFMIYLESSALVVWISNSLPLPIESASIFAFNIEENAGSINLATSQWTIGKIILFLLQSSGLLFLTAWLLERKVEVK